MEQQGKFQVVMTRTYAGKSYANLPSHASKQITPQFTACSLVDVDGVEWRPAVSRRESKHARMSSDWRAFVVCNNIFEGDKVVFQLIGYVDCTTLRCKVDIVRGMAFHGNLWKSCYVMKEPRRVHQRR